MILIGVGHRKQVGKDTMAQFLAKEFHAADPQLVVKRVGFADKLKQICHELYAWAGLKDAQYYEDHPKKKAEYIPALRMTARDVWIEFGTTAVRENVYEHTWVDYVLKGNFADVMLIPDVRFPDEAEGIRKAGGILVKVTRKDVQDSKDKADCALADWTDWDFHLPNNGDLGDLKRMVGMLFPKIMERRG